MVEILDTESSLSYFERIISLSGGILLMTLEEMEKEASDLMRRGFH